MACGFFCLKECTDPECEGCDLDKIPVDWLNQKITETSTFLEKLLIAKARR